MSEKKNRTSGNPSHTESVDWAERLRASMNADHTEPREDRTEETDDELSAMIRSALAGREKPTEAVSLDLDTSDFEEEPAEEIEEEPAEEIPEAPHPIAAEIIFPEEKPLAPRFYSTDDRLNGLSPDEGPGGRRLSELDAENARLLAEMDPLTGTEDLKAPSSLTEDDTNAVSEEKATRAEADETSARETRSEGPDSVKTEKTEKKKAKPHRPRDPLQLGLDDIRPLTPANPITGRGTVTHSSKETKAPHRPAPAVAEPPSDDTDIHVDLGHETDLNTKKAPEQVESLREKTAAEAIHGRGDAVVTNRGREYRGSTESDAVSIAYTRARRAAVIRLCIAATGALLGVLYDLFGFLTLPLSILTFANTPLYPLFGILWMLAVSLIFIPRLLRGLKSLWSFEPTRYAVAALALPVAVAQGVWGICTSSPYLFCGAALLTLTLSALSELFAVQGEKDAFTVVSAGKLCHVLTDEPTPAAVARSKNLPRDTHILTAVRTGRVSDYFARTCRYNPYMGKLNYLFPVALLVAIAAAGITVARGDSLLYQGVPVFTATYLSCLPAAYLIAMSLPAALSNRFLRRRGAAVIGTAAPDEYGRENTHLIFFDGDVMKATHRKDVTLRSDKNPVYWKTLGDVLFRLLNTPLAVEPVLRGDSLDSYRVDVTEQSEGCIRLHLTERETDRAIEVLAGTHDALAKRGIRLPKRTMEESYKNSPESHVMYLAFNGHFHMAYAAEYRVGSSFEQVAEALKALNCGVSVAGFDPMVDPDMKDLLYLRRHTEVDVVRPAAHEAIRRTRSSGLVATNRATDLLYPFAATRRMRRIYRLSHLLCWLGVAVSFAMAALSVSLGQGGLLSSASVLLCQLLSTLISVGLCLIAVRPSALFLTAPRIDEVVIEESAPESEAPSHTSK